MKKGTQYGTPGESIDPHGGYKEQQPQDQSQPVDCRCQGGQQKTLVGIKDPGQEAASAKDRRGDQQDPEQLGSQQLFIGWVFGGEQACNLGGKERGNETERC